MSTLTFKHTQSPYALKPDTLGGVTEQKKAELDALAIKVLDAQHVVEQFQAIVNSLAEKSNVIQNFLTIDENNRSYTYNNKLLINQMVQTANDLLNNSQIVVDEMGLATERTKELAPSVKDLVDKLIYASEIINKLSNTIIRKKALNPLISDDLISMLGTAGKNANDAVAVTLIALKSTFAAQASNLETEMAIGLEFEHAKSFLSLLKTNTRHETSLLKYLNDAYAKAQNTYKQTEKSFKIITQQLSDANSDLSKAQVKLKSLQSGLAAANAAALAS